MKDVTTYIATLDNYLLMEKKLCYGFKPEDHWPNKQPDDQIGFDVFYDTLMKWACNQDDYFYEDFAAADIAREKKEREQEALMK